MRVVQQEIMLTNYMINPLRAFQATEHHQSKIVPKVYKLTLLYYSLLMYYMKAVLHKSEISLPSFCGV